MSLIEDSGKVRMIHADLMLEDKTKEQKCFCVVMFVCFYLWVMMIMSV